MNKRYDYYAGFYKRFIGLGLMISYKDTPIITHERIEFEFRFIIFKFWFIWRIF